MILTDYDIQQLKEKALSEQDTISLIGHPTQYFFACNTGNTEKGICGIDAIILDARPGTDPNNDHFYVDLAITSSVPGFYVEYKNVPVVSIMTINKNNIKESALCHFSDFEIIQKVMNDKFSEPKPKLKVIVDNTTK